MPPYLLLRLFDSLEASNGNDMTIPSSSQITEYMSPSLTPVVLHNLAFQSAASLLPSRSFNTVGFPQRVIFGAQSVHPKVATCILPVYASTGGYPLPRKTRYYPAGYALDRQDFHLLDLKSFLAH